MGSVADLVAAVRAGRPRAVGRAVSLIENDPEAARALAEALAADGGRAHVLGVTGSPGVGKSTVVTALVTTLRAAGLRVGVLAVDPSSPYTGGALLGDRVRMQGHALDPDVFIRSMASRGHLGGLAAATPQAVRVLDAAGCTVVVIETVGVGQSEVEVAALADTTLVLLAPGLGDGVQAAKAGVLETADVLVVNKSDRDGAHAVVRELRSMVALGERGPDDWRPPVVSTVGATGEGVDRLWERVTEHRRHAERTGAWSSRRLARAEAELEALVWAGLRTELRLDRSAGLPRMAAAVSAGELDPYSAADQLRATL